jgi:hypothetical protein
MVGEPVITDEQLDEWEGQTVHKGNRAAAPILRELTPGQRTVAVAEAHTRMNLSGGWNYSSAIWQAVSDLKQGRTPCLDSAAMYRAEEKLRTGR